MRHCSLVFMLSIFLLIGCTEPGTEKVARERFSNVPLESAPPEQFNLQNINPQNAIAIHGESRSYITVATVSPQTVKATVQAPSRVTAFS